MYSPAVDGINFYLADITVVVVDKTSFIVITTHRSRYSISIQPFRRQQSN
jgi:hypothetical protein